MFTEYNSSAERFIVFYFIKQPNLLSKKEKQLKSGLCCLGVYDSANYQSVGKITACLIRFLHLSFLFFCVNSFVMIWSDFLLEGCWFFLVIINFWAKLCTWCWRQTDQVTTVSPTCVSKGTQNWTRGNFGSSQSSGAFSGTVSLTVSGTWPWLLISPELIVMYSESFVNHRGSGGTEWICQMVS